MNGAQTSAEAATRPTAERATRPAEGATIGGTTCVHCGAANGRDRKFCGSCGKPTCEPCPACGTLGPAGEAYCGGCGVDLDEELGRLERRTETALDGAAALAERGNVDEALERLAEVDLPGHSRLAEPAGRLAALREDLASRRGRFRELARVAPHRAAELIADGRKTEALRMLEEVPAGHRSGEHERLLSELQAHASELAELTAQVKRRLAEKAYEGLLGLVERLVELAPDREDAARLAGQLRARERDDHVRLRENLLELAGRSVDAHDYARAVAQLEKVPQDVRDEAHEKRFAEVAELDWLARQLRTAPLADANLLAIADRLIDLCPNDETALKRRAQIAERIARANGPLDRPLWAKTPDETLVGCPVDPPGPPRRLAAADGTDMTTLATGPGRFYVASGLALQALDRAAVSINLLPTDNSGILGKLKARKPRPATAAWGLDVGASGLKAVRLVLGESGDPEIAAARLIPYTSPLDARATADEKRAVIAAALGEFLDAESIGEDRVAAGLPGNQTLGRFVTMPGLVGRKLEEAIRYEARSQIALPMTAVHWGHHVLPAEGGDESERGEAEEDGRKPPADRAKPVDVLIVAAKLAILHEHLDTFAQAGIDVRIVQSDCVALYNYLHFEHLSRAEHAGRPVALCDYGADSANLVVGSRDRIWFRSFARGSEELNGALVKQFNLTRTTAEKVKRRPILARRMRPIDAALRPGMQALAGEIERSLVSYEKASDGAAVSRLLGAGGGFETFGLVRYLRTGE